MLQNAFTTAAPGITFNNAAVSGGGGSNARTVLATRLQGGNPPDSWQLHPDQDLMSAVEDGSVADISDLYTSNGWDSELPETVKAMLQKDGKYYAVPVDAHRANVLWTNPAVLKPDVQAQFNLKKGSAPVLAGVSLDGYPDYQENSAAAFQKLPVVSSLAHAQGAPAEFANTYVDAVTSFLGSKNIDALLKTMTEAQKTQLTS